MLSNVRRLVVLDVLVFVGLCSLGVQECCAETLTGSARDRAINLSLHRRHQHADGYVSYSISGRDDHALDCQRMAAFYAGGAVATDVYPKGGDGSSSSEMR